MEDPSETAGSKFWLKCSFAVAFCFVFMSRTSSKIDLDERESAAFDGALHLVLDSVKSKVNTPFPDFA